MKKEHTQIFIALIDEKIESLEKDHEIMREYWIKYRSQELRFKWIKNRLEYWIELRYKIFNSKI